jgi:hypothetical protein
MAFAAAALCEAGAGETRAGLGPRPVGLAPFGIALAPAPLLAGEVPDAQAGGAASVVAARARAAATADARRGNLRRLALTEEVADVTIRISFLIIPS